MRKVFPFSQLFSLVPGKSCRTTDWLIYFSDFGIFNQSNLSFLLDFLHQSNTEKLGFSIGSPCPDLDPIFNEAYVKKQRQKSENSQRFGYVEKSVEILAKVVT